MPRRKRNYLPGLPYHIVQRGNNRGRCFRALADYATYLDLWKQKSRWYGVAVHAYCLMPNHIHFIVTGSTTDAISNTMKAVGSQYAWHFNRRYRRTGTLWEGRHRPSLIDAENYLLNCYRYVELNPVRAHLVAHPGDFRWSSFRANACGRASWLTPHPVYLELGADARSRMQAYQALCDEALPNGVIELMHEAIHYSMPVGDEAFREAIATRFGLKREYAARGRPRNAGRNPVVKK